MHLADLIPDVDAVLALEPDELGLLMLRVLAQGPKPAHTQLDMGGFLPQAFVRYPASHHSEIEIAVREAWAWLEGAGLLIRSTKYTGPHSIRILSRRAIRIGAEPDPRRAYSSRTIPKATLHPSIREDVWALYHRAKYETAVFEAMKAVEVAVREAAGMPNTLVGVKLMRAAFAVGPTTPGPLTDIDVDAGEQVARMELFSGAIGSYKNPHSHRNVTLDDPDEAAEILLLANHLLRIVDARRKPVSS